MTSPLSPPPPATPEQGQEQQETSNKAEFLTARQLQERDLPNCIRCERLERNPPRKGYPFCKICYDIEMPAKIYRSEIYQQQIKEM